MKTYSFLTDNGFRIDVDGSTPENALNNILKLGQYKYGMKGSGRPTAAFIKYNKNGIGDFNFISTDKTRLIIQKTFS